MTHQPMPLISAIFSLAREAVALSQPESVLNLRCRSCCLEISKLSYEFAVSRRGLLIVRLSGYRDFNEILMKRYLFKPCSYS